MGVYTGRAEVCYSSTSDLNVLTNLSSFIHSLVYAIDGNFHQNLKDKKTDGTDYSLGTGAAYYANEDHFNSWLEFKGEPEKEVRCCSRTFRVTIY